MLLWTIYNKYFIIFNRLKLYYIIYISKLLGQCLAIIVCNRLFLSTRPTFKFEQEIYETGTSLLIDVSR